MFNNKELLYSRLLIQLKRNNFKYFPEGKWTTINIHGCKRKRTLFPNLLINIFLTHCSPHLYQVRVSHCDQRSVALATKASPAVTKFRLDFTQTSSPDGRCDWIVFPNFEPASPCNKLTLGPSFELPCQQLCPVGKCMGIGVFLSNRTRKPQSRTTQDNG